MKEKKISIAKFNIIMSILQQGVTMICGFILPRYILQCFGSDVNGLVSSLTQFLSYVSLLEGGVTGVVTASLYTPLVEKDMEKVSCIKSTAQSFFRKIASVFVLYTLIVSLIYPLVVKSKFSFAYMCSLTLILGISLFIQYFFSITLKILLIADRKVYIVSSVQIITTLLNTIMTIVIIKYYPDIHVARLVSAIIFIIQPIIYNKMVKKHFKLVNSNDVDNSLIKQRWDAFGINIAAFIHNNTDIVVLSLLCSLKEVSVYSVYFMVVTGLKSVVLAISNAISPSLGHAYAKKNPKELASVFNKCETIIIVVTFFLFIVGGLSITPFVEIYTSQVKDANYYQPLFGWLIILAEMIFCIREPYVMMAYCANRFKDFTKIAYVEAVINIITSVVLVLRFGIVGVAIGTLVSMGYRTICQILYLREHILKRTALQLFSKILLFVVASLIVVIISKACIIFDDKSVWGWILYTLENSVLAAVIYAFLFLIIRKKEN